MIRWLEHLAVQWLVGRGYIVLPQPFLGMVVGGGVAQRVTGVNRGDVANGATHDRYVIDIPRGAKIIAVSNTIVNRGGEIA